MTIRLAIPDSAFRLTADERARVRPDLDVDALERLLAHVTPDARPILLDVHACIQHGEAKGLRPTRMGDPELQPLLDEIWAPVWESAGLEAINEETNEYPGKELARRRLQQRPRSS